MGAGAGAAVRSRIHGHQVLRVHASNKARPPNRNHNPYSPSAAIASPTRCSHTGTSLSWRGLRGSRDTQRVTLRSGESNGSRYAASVAAWKARASSTSPNTRGKVGGAGVAAFLGGSSAAAAGGMGRHSMAPTSSAVDRPAIRVRKRRKASSMSQPSIWVRRLRYIPKPAPT